jgi:translation initiation factor 5B
MLEENGIEVRKAGFGDVSRKDLMEAEAVKQENPLKAVIFAFNVKTLPDVEKQAADLNIKIFTGDVIYSVIDNYKAWVDTESELTKEQVLKRVTLPAKVKLLPGYIFRQSKPAIVGVEILTGTVKPKIELMNESGEVVGTVKEIQEEKESVSEAKAGSKVALSIQGAAVGKNIKENDLLYVKIPIRDIQLIKTKLNELLSEEELETLNEIEKITK